MHSARTCAVGKRLSPVHSPKGTAGIERVDYDPLPELVSSTGPFCTGSRLR